LDTVEYYCADKRRWQYARQLHVPRASLGLCRLGNRLVAVGGENRAMQHVADQSPVYLNSVEVYNKVSLASHMCGSGEGRVADGVVLG
jgi:N-acetylneuraminic acid mutarotase